MSPEVCPFCGKTYKRLKSHLPHCKAAASSRTPATERDDTENQDLPSQLPAAQGEKNEQPSPSAASPPLRTKKKKLKLSEQIKAASMSPSSASSPVTTLSQSSSPFASISKPETKTALHDLTEAVRPKQVSEGSQEVTRPASEDLPSASTPFVEDPLSSRTTAQTETKPNPSKDTVKDNAHASFLPTETKPKGASKKKAPKMKKASQPTAGDSSLDPTVSEHSSQSSARNSFLLDNEGEIEDLSVNKIILKSGSGHQARITLQDVRATLGRANAIRPSILSQIEAADATPALLTKGKDVNSCLVTTKTLSDQLPSTRVQHAELQSAQRKSSKSIQAPLIPQWLDGSPQPELPASPAAPLPSAHLLSEVSQTCRLQTPGVSEAHKLGRHTTGLPATLPPPLNPPSRLHPSAGAAQAPPARAESWRDDDRLMTERSQCRVGEPNTANNATQGAGTQQSLGQVRLREVPEWLARRAPSRPRDVVEMVQRGWQWYYKRYIDVKKGGVGGLGMLLAGYCVLSYIWSYPHIKRDRWRRYH